MRVKRLCDIPHLPRTDRDLDRIHDRLRTARALYHSCYLHAGARGNIDHARHADCGPCLHTAWARGQDRRDVRRAGLADG